MEDIIASFMREEAVEDKVLMTEEVLEQEVLTEEVVEQKVEPAEDETDFLLTELRAAKRKSKQLKETWILPRKKTKKRKQKFNFSRNTATLKAEPSITPMMSLVINSPTKSVEVEEGQSSQEVYGLAVNPFYESEESEPEPEKKEEHVPPVVKVEKKPYRMINNNPLGLVAKTKSGVILRPKDAGFREAFAKAGKRTEETERRYEKEFARFEAFVEDSFGKQMLTDLLASTMEEKAVADIVGDFMTSRINLTKYEREGVTTFLDTTTAQLVWQKLSAMLEDRTEYRLSSKGMRMAKRMKNSYLRAAKKVAGLGELANQPMPITHAQLSYLLHNDHLDLYTPKGLQCLFYIMFCIIFLPRVRSEAANVQRGEFKFLLNADGSDRGVVYAANGSLKRDSGVRVGANAAPAYKQPMALPCPEPKLNFCVILRELFRYLDMLPHDGNRDSQYLFHTPVAGNPGRDKPFYLKSRLGIDSFDGLFRWAMRSSGMDLTGVDTCNQVLRTTAFTMHQLIGELLNTFINFSNFIFFFIRSLSR